MRIIGRTHRIIYRLSLCVIVLVGGIVMAILCSEAVAAAAVGGSSVLGSVFLVTLFCVPVITTQALLWTAIGRWPGWRATVIAGTVGGAITWAYFLG